MNTRDMERELTAALQRHAEAAMNRTDTQAEQAKFHTDVEDRSRRDRRRWAVGAAAAAVVAAVAGMALWSADLGDERSSGPAGDPGQSAEDVAQGFMEAFAAGDRDRVVSYLAPGSRLGEELSGEMANEGTWRREYFLEPCREQYTSSRGTWVTCPFAYHVLRSEELGLGPFGGNNSLTVAVADGKVTPQDLVYDYGSNGQAALFEAILAWVGQNHPDGLKIIEKPSVGNTPAEERRAQRLWDRYVGEYVAAQTQ